MLASLILFDNSNRKFSGFISGLKDGTAFQLRLKDRLGAGRVLASILKSTVGACKKNMHANDAPLLMVFGIPRGGVIVADVVAETLDVDYFDIVISRKLRAPENKENSIGAIAPDGSLYLDDFMVHSLKVPAEYIEKEKREQMAEISRRKAVYRPTNGDRSRKPIAGGRSIRESHNCPLDR